MKDRVHFSSKDYNTFDKKGALKSFAVFCQIKANTQFNTLTIKEAVKALKISQSGLYKHLKVLKSLGYAKIEDKTIILKGQLTKNSYRTNRFSLTEIPKRKKNQYVHMSVHMGNTVKETQCSLQGLKIVSSVLKQEKAIIQRHKANSNNKSVSLTDKGNSIGFTTITNQNAATTLGFKSKSTGQNRLRECQKRNYFKMQQAFILFDTKTTNPRLIKELEMRHPAIKIGKLRGKTVFVRQIGNQISSIGHNHFGELFFIFRLNEFKGFYQNLNMIMTSLKETQ